MIRFLSYLFGSGADRYASTPFQISREEIRMVISKTASPNFSDADERAIEETIANRRYGNEYLTLPMMYETLTDLVGKRIITKYDRRDTMRLFERFVQDKYKKQDTSV